MNTTVKTALLGLNMAQLKDVAKEMGTSRENVSKSLRRSLARLRNSFGVEERPFHHNRFYNPQD